MEKITFNNPPVVEVVFGVQYLSEKYDPLLAYDFYNIVKSKFPKVEEHIPIKTDSVKRNILNRYYFINDTSDKLIQIQDGRFLLNWRNSPSADQYPNFEKILSEFSENFEIFLKIANERTYNLKIEKLELTYVDHIEIFDSENNLLSINEIFNFLNLENKLNASNNFHLNISVPCDDIDSNLNLKINSAKKNFGDQKDIFVLTTSVFGKLAKKSTDYKIWFDKSHEIIYYFFHNIISEKVKQSWGAVK